MNPKRKDGVQVQDLPDGSALLYDTETATAYPVTETAALAWRGFDGERSVDDVVDQLHARFEAERETIADDVRKLLEDLESKGLLQPSGA